MNLDNSCKREEFVRVPERAKRSVHMRVVHAYQCSCSTGVSQHGALPLMKTHKSQYNKQCRVPTGLPNPNNTGEGRKERQEDQPSKTRIVQTPSIASNTNSWCTLHLASYTRDGFYGHTRYQ